MLHYALNLEGVSLAEETAAWPAPLSLSVELNEVVLLEGAGPEVSLPLMEVAATLQSPAGGRVRHWGLEAAEVSREGLFHLRSRMAYISARQMLLHRLTLGGNIALAPCYHLGISEPEALAAHADLLAQLNLRANPDQVSAAVYARAVWAREMVKEPELILAVIGGELATPAGATMLATVLQDYLARHGGAAMLAGESLQPFYSLGHRLLVLEAGELRKQPLLEHRARPLTAYLALV